MYIFKHGKYTDLIKNLLSFFFQKILNFFFRNVITLYVLNLQIRDQSLSCAYFFARRLYVLRVIKRIYLPSTLLKISVNLKSNFWYTMFNALFIITY